MRWSKIVLIVQAIAVLLIASAFILQMVKLDNAKISELKIELNKGNSFVRENSPKVIVDLKKRYMIAGFILLLVGLIELVLISTVDI